MKKTILCMSLSAIIIMTFSLISFAAGIDNWIVLPGFLVDDQPAKPVVEETENGLKMNIKGYYTGDGNYGGIIYKTPIDLDGAVVEVFVEKFPIESTDAWLGINFLNKPAFFNVSDTEESAGFVSLIRPANGIINYEAFEHVTSFAGQGGVPIDAELQNVSIKMEVKKNDAGGYTFTVNGVDHTAQFTNLPEVFPDGKAYIVIGASSIEKDDIIVYVKSINGQPVVTPDPVAEEPVADEAADKNPETADDTLIIYILLASLSLASLISLKKRILL